MTGCRPGVIDDSVLQVEGERLPGVQTPEKLFVCRVAGRIDRSAQTDLSPEWSCGIWLRNSDV
jgi:hypothetical protein